MSPTDLLLWMRQGREILVHERGHQPGSVRLLVAYQESGEGVELLLPAEDARGPIVFRVGLAAPPPIPVVKPENLAEPPAASQVPAGRLTGMQRRLLAAATGEPQKTAVLIRRAGCRLSSYSRAAVAFLVANGYLARAEGGGVVKAQQPGTPESRAGNQPGS